MDKNDKKLPFVLTLGVVLIDQLTKWLVTVFIPMNGIGASFMGGFLRIIHARNTAIAFSIGTGMSQNFKMVFFSLLPLVILGLIAFYLFKTDTLTHPQRWAACGILGGGAGNLVDRIFRPLGVVDFIDVKFYGLFGLDRWPTFNIADSAIVVCGFLLVISFLSTKKNS